MSSSTCPKVFFDTQICANAAKGLIQGPDWDSVLSYIREVGEYWISPLTLGEILLGIAKSDKYFSIGQARLRKIYSGGDCKYFDFSRYFVASTLGLVDVRPKTLEDDPGLVIQVCLLAQSRGQLLNEGVPVPYLTAPVRIRLDRFQEEINEIQGLYVQMLTTLKGTRRNALSPEEWADPALQFYGIKDSAIARRRFIDALSAAYQFETTILDLARNPNYNVRKRVSDQVDAQQLCYLCDPRVVFVTDDSDHRTRIPRNNQSSRILTFGEISRRAKASEPLLAECE